MAAWLATFSSTLRYGRILECGRILEYGRRIFFMHKNEHFVPLIHFIWTCVTCLKSGGCKSWKGFNVTNRKEFLSDRKWKERKRERKGEEGKKRGRWNSAQSHDHSLLFKTRECFKTNHSSGSFEVVRKVELRKRRDWAKKKRGTRTSFFNPHYPQDY